MTNGDSKTKAFVTNRRRLLFGLGVAGGAFATGLTVSRAEPGTGDQVADAPVSDKALERQPFLGPHQAGVVTPRPAAGMIAVFDVLADTPAEVERLFKTLTARIAFLIHGGIPPVLHDKLPPADSGILGPVIPPDNLTMTLSLGASFFEQRDWLPPP